MTPRTSPLVALFVLLAFSSTAYCYPDSGKKLHYQFRERFINFEGRTKRGDNGVLYRYDLSSGKMSDVGNPWSSRSSDNEGMPLDNDYIFDFDISTKNLGPKQTYIISFKCQRPGDSEGPLWFCNHKNPAQVGYYPFRTEADHAIIFVGKPNPNDKSTLCQWYRMWGKPDTYCTVVMLVDRTDGKHIVYISDEGFYYYVDKSRHDVADYDRLVLRKMAKAGIREIVVYNRHLTGEELRMLAYGGMSKNHLKAPSSIVQDAENGEFKKMFGLRGWTDNYLLQSFVCLVLMVVSVYLNVKRKGPYAYRGKGWVVLIMLISFIFMQFMFKYPLGGIHVMEVSVFLSYLVVSIGPVTEYYSRGANASFWTAFMAMLGLTGAFLGSFLWSMWSSLTSGPISVSRTTTKMRDGRRVVTGSEEHMTPVLASSITNLVIYAAVAFGILWTLSNLVITIMFVFVVIRFVRNLKRADSSD